MNDEKEKNLASLRNFFEIRLKKAINITRLTIDLLTLVEVDDCK